MIWIDNFGTLKYNFQKTSQHTITFMYYTNYCGDYVNNSDRINAARLISVHWNFIKLDLFCFTVRMDVVYI